MLSSDREREEEMGFHVDGGGRGGRKRRKKEEELEEVGKGEEEVGYEAGR